MRATSSGQARPLHFLYGINGWDTQDRGATYSRFGNHPLGLLGGDQGAHGIMHHHDFGIRRSLRQGVGNGLLSRLSAMHYLRRFSQPRQSYSILQGGNFIIARGNDKVINGGACRQSANVKITSGTPSRSRNCLGVSAPIRVPRPAAGRMASVMAHRNQQSIARGFLGKSLRGTLSTEPRNRSDEWDEDARSRTSIPRDEWR